MKSCKFIIPLAIILFLTFCTSKKAEQSPVKPNDVTDVDGNVYHTVTIFGQVWMVENLRVSHYQNGDPIPNIKVDTIWSETKTGAYCDYYNLEKNGQVFGHLYNWFAVNDKRNLAPKGWHIPSIDEWEILVNNVKNSASSLKCRTGWVDHYNPNNSSGFEALPSGWRCGISNEYCELIKGARFCMKDSFCAFWSSSSFNEDIKKIIELENDSNNIKTGAAMGCNSGLSVRCIKNSSAGNQSQANAKRSTGDTNILNFNDYKLVLLDASINKCTEMLGKANYHESFGSTSQMLIVYFNRVRENGKIKHLVLFAKDPSDGRSYIWKVLAVGESEAVDNIIISTKGIKQIH